MPVHAATDNAAADSAVAWLRAQQGVDGSWCTRPDVRMLCTTEVVSALRSYGVTDASYFGGIAWIENHNAGNADYSSRRLQVLSAHGDDLRAEAAALKSAQRLANPGNKGWGISKAYDGDVLDTALVLRAPGVATTTEISSAIGFLKAAQLTGSDRGWRVAGDGASDEIVTAQVIRTLLPYMATDTTLTTPVADAAATLAARVTASSPSLPKAHAALALLSRDPASAGGRSLLDSLKSSQSADGSWGQDPYLTALAVNTLATALGDNGSSASEVVVVPDPALRSAINRALGRNNGDAITKGDLRRLATLNAAGLGISNLTGLQHATNIQSIDLRNNQINSLSPLAGLPQFRNAQLAGNPLSTSADTDGDGVKDSVELARGTYPLNPDSDGDTLLDGADPYPTSPTRFPVAQNDTVSAQEDTQVIVNVLANDSDADGDPLIVKSVTTPEHGTATISADKKTVTYLPANDYNGPDSFTYTASDERGGLKSATVTVTVAAVNDPPVVDLTGAAATGLDFSTSYTEDAAAVLIVDGTSLTDTVGLTVTDVDSDNIASAKVTITNRSNGSAELLSVTVGSTGIGAVFDPATGVLSLTGSFPKDKYETVLRTLKYQNTSNGASGAPRVITVVVNDGSANSGPAVATVTVVPANDAPAAVADSYSVNEDGVLTIAVPGVMGNDTDPDGNALTAAVVAAPTKGTLVLNANGSFSYTPNANVNGSDSFTYRVNDGTVNSSAATVTIAIAPVNDPPVAVNNSHSVNEDTVLTVAAPGVLGNDTDQEGTALTAAVVTAPGKGSLTLNPNGSFSYTPSANANGSDSFTYRANDGAANSNPATVTITVNPVNDAPVAVNNSYTVNEDKVLTVPAPGVLGNDTDADGNPLTAAVVAAPTKGTLVLNADGSLSYTPGANYNGSDSFTYRVSDGTLNSNTATVTITVSPVNDAAVAVANSYSVNEDTTLTVAAPGVLANDTDLEGNALTAVQIAAPAKGTLTLNANGGFSYVPNANVYGTDSFSYRANDGSANSNTATVTITINPVNDGPPVAQEDAATTNTGAAISIAVLANDTDVDANPLVVQSVSVPAKGTATVNADAKGVTYTPQAGYAGLDSFTYVVSDGAGGTATGTVKLRVLGSYKYYVLDVATQGSNLCMVSLFNDNTIVVGATAITLQQYQRACPAVSLPVGSVIAGSAAFSVGNDVAGADMPAHVTQAGTSFVLPSWSSGTGRLYFMPTGNAATVSLLSSDGTQRVDMPVAKGGFGTTALGPDLVYSGGRLSSTTPIVVAYLRDSDKAARVLAPAATDLWGVRSMQTFVTAQAAATTVTAYAEGGASASYVLAAGQTQEILVGSGLPQGQGSAIHVVANNPVSVHQEADGDVAVDMTTYFGKNQFAKRYGIPVDAQYVTVVCAEADTQVTLTEPGVAAVSAVCAGSATTPGKLYFSGDGITAGTRVEATKQVYLIYEPLQSNRERNLKGAD